MALGAGVGLDDGEHAPQHRPHAEEQDRQGEQAEHAELEHTGRIRRPASSSSQPRSAAPGAAATVANGRLTTSTTSPRLSSTPAALRTRAVELLQLLRPARLVAGRPVRLRFVDAVDLDRDRQPAQRSTALGLVAHRARDLVVDRLLGLVALLAAARRTGRCRGPLGRQVARRAHLIGRLGFLLIGHLLGRLRAANDLALRIVGLGRGRDLVEVEVGTDRGVDLASTDRAFQQLDDLAAQPILQRRPIGLGIARPRAGRHPGAAGTARRLPAPSTSVTASGLRPGHGGRDQLADAGDLALVERLGTAQGQDDRGGGRPPRRGRTGVRSGATMCTRAERTLRSVPMVRASSPSTARRRLTLARKSLVVNGLASSSSS